MRSSELCSREMAVPFEVPPRISLAVPDSRRVAEIRKTLTESAKPVRPLPSNGAIMLLCVGVFILLAVLLALPAGLLGFSRATASEAAIEYAVLLLLALALAGAVVEQMIPGARRSVPPAAGVLLAILLLSLTATLLFPRSEPNDFVSQGVPCMRLGLLCAIPAACLTAFMMRRGFVTDTVSAAIAGGGLSGLAGAAVLALHCPIFDATHIIAWHAGVIAVTSLAGAFLGWVLARSR